MSSNPTICLLGDAILDDYYTLSDKERDLKKELTDLRFDVYNCATDDVKVVDVINGIVPNENYMKSRSYSYPTEKDGKMYPLKSVTSFIGINKSFASVYDGIKSFSSFGVSTKPDTMVVISMGGNDIHSKFGNVILGPEYLINNVITPEFISNYKTIIEMIKTSCNKLVLVSIYLPYLGIGSAYGLYAPVAKPVIDKWNKFIHSLAQEYNIPVLDLSKTLNVGNRSHYGNDNTRTSNISNKCIANCISYIYKNYNGYETYYAANCSKTVTVE